MGMKMGETDFGTATAGSVLDPNLPADTIIWRYMDIGKFLAFLEGSALYFPRLDMFEDEYEGSPTKAALLREKDQSLNPDYSVYSGEPIGKERFLRERKFVYANCWHESTSENLAMWKLYGAQTNSVAIVSSALELAKALAFFSSEEMAYQIVTRISYIDHVTEDFEERGAPDIVAQYVHKYVAYSFEKEVRALFLHKKWTDGLAQDDTSTPRGYSVPVDLGRLVHRIILPPQAPLHLVDALQKLVSDRYQLSIPVRRSSMDGRSVFGNDT